MAIQGTFLADFSSFYDAVQKAEVSLKGFETGAAKVETSLNKMVDTFSGRKLITEATLAAEAIERMGGVSKLTANELAVWGSKAAEAVDKIHAVGDRAEPTLLKLAAAHKESAKATDEAAKANQGWAASLGQVDSILQSVGINIGGEARSLRELEGVAGKSASSLGALGTAGLAVGTGMAAWGITRAAMEFLQLDQYVAKAWQSLLGFGDAAAAAAAANADVLAKASAIAGVQVTNLGDAMKIVDEEAKKHADSLETVASKTAAYHATIAKMQADGSFDKLSKEMESHIFSVEKLTQRYGKDAVEAFQFFQMEQKKATDAETAAADKQHANNERMLKDVQTTMDANKVTRDLEAKALLGATKLWDEYYALRVSHGGTANDTARAQIQQWAKDVEANAIKAGTATKGFYAALEADSRERLAGVGINWDLWKTKSIKALNEIAENERRTLNEMIKSGEFHRDEIEKQTKKYEEAKEAARGYGQTAVAAQDAARAAAEKHNKELEKQKKLEQDAAENRAKGNSMQFDLSTEQGRAQVDPKIAVWLHDGYSLEQASAIAFAMAWGFPLNMNDPLFRTKGPRVPGFAGGVQDFGGGLALVGERGPELVSLPGGADVIPIDRAAAGGTTVNMVANFHIVDTEANIARRVSDHVMRQILIGRKLGFA